MVKPRVIVDTLFRPRDLVFSSANWARVNELADVVWGEAAEFPADRFSEVRDAEVIIGGWWRYGEVSDWPNLRAFMEVGGGLPSPAKFDYSTAFARNIRVLSCSPAFGPAVAEMGVGLALACARQIGRTNGEFRTGDEPWSHSEFRGEFTLYEKTVGLVGFGSLGRHLMQLLRPWGVRFQAIDPWMTEAYLESQGVQPVGLDELLATSDVTFVLATPSEANRGLLSREKLALVPDGRVLVLLSRAHLVDFEALADEVVAGRFFAGIDVYPSEPFDVEHRLRQSPFAVLSSHRAGTLEEAIRRIGEIVTRDLEAVLRGLPPREMMSAEAEYLALRGA
jgi:phosphoglycerate dehydrogenase-like enzyme